MAAAALKRVAKTASAKAVKTPAVKGAKAKAKDLEVARQVLQLESSALLQLAETLDQRFVAAVDCIVRLKGRLIITGMGKSGHVARKIAATMASTGTPAFFVHPGEASHGDLGMVTDKDAVLALSNSGKVPELRDMILYTRRRKIPLIGITANASSPLGQESDILLLLPKLPEAGTLALAPTTSTTMQIALGDALAVALMERRQFRPEDFHGFHPGGQLGKQFIRVRDLMHRDLPLVTGDIRMGEALVEMTQKAFGCVGVVDDAGALLGIITDGDLRRKMSKSLLTQKTLAVMTPSPKTIPSDTLALEALGEMTAGKPKITNMFVVDDGKPVGIIHIHDLLRAGVA